jgi:prepilin-type N-terminal cleavage/methylation domain-containing protein
MMKKEGFTIIEVLLVITIFAIMTTMLAPAILKAIKLNNEQKYVSLEKVLKTNIELYNVDYNEDIWGFDMSTAPDCAELDVDNILEVNPDIDLDDCVIGEMWIGRDLTNNNYSYNIQLKCGEQATDTYAYTTEDYTAKPAICLDLTEE